MQPSEHIENVSEDARARAARAGADGHVTVPLTAFLPGKQVADESETLEFSVMDNFTIEDRKELIKQTFLLDSFHREIHDLKVNVRESLVKIDQEKADKRELSTAATIEHEKRLTSLEGDRIKFLAQIKTILWMGGVIITSIQVVVGVVIKVFIAK